MGKKGEIVLQCYRERGKDSGGEENGIGLTQWARSITGFGSKNVGIKSRRIHDLLGRRGGGDSKEDEKAVGSDLTRDQKRRR